MQVKRGLGTRQNHPAFAGTVPKTVPKRPRPGRLAEHPATGYRTWDEAVAALRAEKDAAAEHAGAVCEMCGASGADEPLDRSAWTALADGQTRTRSMQGGLPTVMLARRCITVPDEPRCVSAGQAVMMPSCTCLSAGGGRPLRRQTASAVPARTAWGDGSPLPSSGSPSSRRNCSACALEVRQREARRHRPPRRVQARQPRGTLTSTDDHHARSHPGLLVQHLVAVIIHHDPAHPVHERWWSLDRPPHHPAEFGQLSELLHAQLLCPLRPRGLHQDVLHGPPRRALVRVPQSGALAGGGRPGGIVTSTWCRRHGAPLLRTVGSASATC